MQVKLKTKTVGVDEYEGKSIDSIIVGIARISSSRELNELFDEPEKLLRHCLVNNHWSIFDTVNLGFEIITSRAMGREILRHDFKKQEFSQRYSSVLNFEDIETRKQSKNNRQSSTEFHDPVISEGQYYNEYIANRGLFTNEQSTCSEEISILLEHTKALYQELLNAGVARESSRLVLPETTQTVLYVNGTIRTVISFLNQRLHQTAQKECRLVAEAIRDIFIQECPIISQMLYNFEDAYDIHILERVQLEKWGVYQMIKDNGFRKLKNL
jgi:thymidylate synthase (FAD)